MSESAKLPFFVSGQWRRDMGQIVKVLAEVGRKPEFVTRRKRKNVTFSPGKFSGLIILGDTRYSATDEQGCSQDRDWLKAAIASNRPVLGICYGAQLMAAYLDEIPTNSGPMGRMPDREHAGMIAEVELRGAGETDPIMAPLLRSRLAIMAHKESFQAPRGSDGLAWSTGLATEHCEAFRVGPPEHAVYGFQFHPEPDEEMLNKGWFEEMPDENLRRTAANTGLEMLRAWAKLADAR